MALIERGVVEATERARRDKELPAIALVVGRMAPVSHRGALAIATAAAIKDDAALALVLDRALERLCLAATALWVHAELGTHEELGPRLQERCPTKKASAWTELALARPRPALLGLGLTNLGTGPAHVVALEMYWCGPAGHGHDARGSQGGTAPPGRERRGEDRPPAKGGEARVTGDRSRELEPGERDALAAGKHTEVAAGLRERDRADLAGWVLEQIWDWDAALAAYRQSRRPVDALRVALESGAAGGDRCGALRHRRARRRGRGQARDRPPRDTRSGRWRRRA